MLEQVRAMVWMSMLHGSRGIIYFVHEWKPRFNEAALLDDPPMLAEVTRINRRIAELAPVLDSPTWQDKVRITPDNPDVPVAVMAKRHAGTIYMFAVAMRAGATQAILEIADLAEDHQVTVLGEDRMLTLHQGRLTDQFGPWQAHLANAVSKANGLTRIFHTAFRSAGFLPGVSRVCYPRAVGTLGHPADKQVGDTAG